RLVCSLSLLMFRVRQITREDFAGLREHWAQRACVNGGDGEAAALPVATRLAHHRSENLCVEQVGFVEDDEARDACEIKFAENAINGRELLLPTRIRGVNQMDQEIAVADLFERRAESGDQVGRQIAYEADRVV